MEIVAIQKGEIKMKKKVFSLFVVVVLIVSIPAIIFALEATDYDNIPYQYQVEWQEEHYVYQSHEISDISQQLVDVAKFISASMAHLTDEDVESGYALYVFGNLIEMYKMPIILHYITSINAVAEEDGVQALSSQGVFVVTGRQWTNGDPNFNVPTSISYSRLTHSPQLGGTFNHSGTLFLDAQTSALLICD